MKKLLLLLLPMLVITSCSIQEDETGMYDDPIKDLNAIAQDEGCDIVIVKFFEDFGQIHVTNDNENLYITVAANEGYSLENIKLHIADEYSGFPTVGKGNLPPGQMDVNQNFSPFAQEHSFSFSLDEYNFEDNQIYIASKADFTNGKDTFSSWAGNLSGGQGNWNYMEYDVQECSIVQDPCENLYPDLENTVCLTSLNNLTLQGVKAYYNSMVSVNTDLSPSQGSYSPTLDEIFNEITDSNNQPITGSYSTIFSIETNNCGPISFELLVNINSCSN